MTPNSLSFTIFLGLLAALPALSIDISAPTLALLPHVLGTSKLVAGLTLSFFMGGFALGQFLGGNLSDRHGRKPTLLAGSLAYCLTGVACALSSSGPAMVVSRFGQGVAAGLCAVLSFAIVQDLFRGAAAQSKRAYVAVIVGVAPIMAPALGSGIVEVLGWRAVHLALAVGGSALVIVVWLWFTESHPIERPLVRPTTDHLGKLSQDTHFVMLASVNAFSYGAVFAYIAGSPIIVRDYYQAGSRIYAAVFACTAIAFAAGAWTGGRLVRRGLTAQSLLSSTLSASVAASLALAVTCLASPTISGPVALCLLAFIQFCRGMISPNLQHLAIERQSQRAGVASAAFGVSQLLGGALASVAVAALLSGFGPFAVAGPILLSSVAALVLWWMI